MSESNIVLKINELNLKIFKLLSTRYKSMNLDVTPVQSKIMLAIYDNELDSCQKDIERVISCTKSLM